MSDKEDLSVSSTYLKNLEKKVRDLKLLVDVSSITSSSLELNELMPLVMEKAQAVMDAEACSVLFYNPEVNKLEFEVALSSEDSTSHILKKTISLDIGQGIAGWVAENRRPLIIKDVSKDDRFFIGADRKTGFVTKGVIAVPLIGRSGLIGVVEIINPGKNDLDQDIFELLCGQFAIAIENARFHRKSLERERLKQQLEIAATIQKSFLPESPVIRKGRATVSALNIPTFRVGGDVYDFIEPAEGTLGVLIGDVSGKGISAALYMAKFISDFRNVARQVGSPEVALNQLNSLASKAPMGMFLTATYALLDTATGVLRLCVAGHPPAIHISKDAVRVTDLPSGPPLGIVPTDYPVATMQLQAGDRLLLLTDGVFDAKNRAGQRLGLAHVAEFAARIRHEEEIVQRLADHVHEFSEGCEQADDITLVEIRWGADSG
jgi:sigma-B regulation protein RsbU (phosphoserine phosphatase)